MPALIELEAFWRSDVLAASEATLRRRLQAHPTGQFVAVAPSGQLLGAMYTQRVASRECLLSTTRESELELHTPSGAVVHLLGVVQRAGANVGDLLRRYVLHLVRLDATVEVACGVTRCRSFEASSGVEYQAHVDRGDDPGLLFHSSAGARIGSLVAGYRPLDTANLGHGVLVCYELRAEGLRQSANAATTARGAGGTGSSATAALALPATLSECESVVIEVFGSLSYGDSSSSSSSGGGGGWDSKKHIGFMDLGIDSLDAQKFVQNLNARLGLQLSNTVIFEHPSIREVRAQEQQR